MKHENAPLSGMDGGAFVSLISKNYLSPFCTRSESPREVTIW